MKPILELKNISKKFYIGKQRQPYLSLRDSLFSVFSKEKSHSEFHALNDISFDVFPGESIAIIGKNGAGKSTLLKILSKITPPTSGKIIARGRIASLLEVGTGFHPELTGRENVFLNGSILGMTRQEIKGKFDEIVDFSGIEKFIDTPVKHYSSGMYLRLAFSVAAHLEPEILIIDEVLAVGDAEFQKKCLGKMEDVSKNMGRTILFVSHNLAAVTTLCSKGILLENGTLKYQGTVKSAVDKYLGSENNLIPEWDLKSSTHKAPTEDFKFLSLKVKSSNGKISSHISSIEGCTISIKYELFKTISNARIGFKIKNLMGQTIFTSSDIDTNPTLLIAKHRNPGIYQTECQIPGNFLRPGNYLLSVWAGYPARFAVDEISDVLSFEVIDTGSVESLIAEGSDAIISSILKWNTD